MVMHQTLIMGSINVCIRSQMVNKLRKSSTRTTNPAYPALMLRVGLQRLRLI